MSSSFNSLLKNSRLAQVAAPLSKNINIYRRHPTHQIIQTTQENINRNEFGLKANLPSKVKSKFVAYNDLDNRYGMPDFEQSPGFYMNSQKFRSMNVPVDTDYQTNPLFSGATGKAYKMSQLKLFHLNSNSTKAEMTKVLKNNPGLRKEFYNYLLETEPKTFLTTLSTDSKSLLFSKLYEFLNIAKLNRKRLSLKDLVEKEVNGSLTRVSGTGGLSYVLKGRLGNSPNGSQKSSVAPGRLLNAETAAIGGFVSDARSFNNATYRNSSVAVKSMREVMSPFEIDSARMNPSGGVTIKASIIRSKESATEYDVYNTRSSTRGYPQNAEQVEDIMRLLQV